jgi:hypothetical protein
VAGPTRQCHMYCMHLNTSYLHPLILVPYVCLAVVMFTHGKLSQLTVVTVGILDS